MEGALATMTVPLLVLDIPSVILGIYPKLVTDFLFPIIGGLMTP